MDSFAALRNPYALQAREGTHNTKMYCKMVKEEAFSQDLSYWPQATKWIISERPSSDAPITSTDKTREFISRYNVNTPDTIYLVRPTRKSYE